MQGIRIYLLKGGDPGVVLDNQFATIQQLAGGLVTFTLQSYQKEVTKYLNSEEDTQNWQPYFDFQKFL